MTTIDPPPRGRHLLTADRRFSTGGGLVSRIVGRGAARLLDRIDSGLEQGSIRLRLPDGSERTHGGRKPGPDATVALNRWRALVRLAGSGSVGWFRAWMEGEWESPDLVALFELFMCNSISLERKSVVVGRSVAVRGDFHGYLHK